MPGSCNVLMIYPRFGAGTFWNFAATCELMGAKYPTAPLGLITVAALLPETWTVRLVRPGHDRRHAAAAQRHGCSHRSLPGERQADSHRRAGCDLGSARLPRGG